MLKKDSGFSWSQELQDAFEQAREEIVKLVESGVRYFRLGRWLALVTDWSKTGIGFVLWQKRCSCRSIHPACCQGGWVVIMVGSRFCTPAEARYHPIEGSFSG